MPGADTFDNVGHEIGPQAPAPIQLTAGAVSTSAVGTISPNANAGATATVTIGPSCTDRAGNFLVNSVGAGQAAGIIASVRFANPYPAKPSSVQVNINNETANAGLLCTVANVNQSGFDIVSTILTVANNYRVNYYVTT